jgi:hypothetical protein
MGAVQNPGLNCREFGYAIDSQKLIKSIQPQKILYTWAKFL